MLGETQRGVAGVGAVGESQAHPRFAAGFCHDDRGTLIVDLPALRYRQLEAQRGMVENVIANEALARIVADDHALDVAEIFLFPDVGPGIGGNLIRDCHDTLGSITRVRVGGLPRGKRFALCGRDALQCLKETRALFGGVTGAGRVIHAQRVGLMLRLAAVAKKKHLGGFSAQVENGRREIGPALTVSDVRTQKPRTQVRARREKAKGENVGMCMAIER